MPRKKMQKSSRRTSIDDLPDECLAYVFTLMSFLDRNSASLTCRRWRSLDALSRHCLRFTYDSDGWPYLPLFLLQALHALPRVLSIAIEGEGRKIPAGFFVIARTHQQFAQLTALELLSCANVSDMFLACLPLACPALTHLSLFDTAITDEGLLSLAEGYTKLISLDVSFCAVTDLGIDAILARCPNMEDVSVGGCSGFKGWGLRHGKALKKVEAGACRMNDFANDLQGVTSLQDLSLPYIQEQPVLALIGKCCKLLEVLCLQGDW